MLDKDKWQEIFSTLSKNKLRTALTAFGVGWGILMLILMLGAGTGLQNGVSKEFDGMAVNSVFLWSRSTSIAYKGFKRKRRFSFKNDDTEALRNEIPEIEHLSPGLQLGGWRGANNVKRGNKIGAFEVNGYLPVAKDIKLLKIKRGRFINDLDVEEERKIAVIGQRVRDVLFTKDENPIGEYLQVQGVYFKIVGQFKSSRNGDKADGEDQSIYIPFNTFQKVFNMGDRVQWYVLTSKPSVPASVVDEKARALLKRRHQVHPDDPGGVGGFNAQEEFEKVNNVFLGINFLSWFVGIFTLLAGVIGISNIMLVIIKERTKEIGIRRSIGATPFSIVSQIILESLTLTILSGSIGFMIGVALVEYLGGMIEHEAFSKPQIDFGVAVVAMIILAISGVLAGLIPANRAIKIRPVDALRTE